MAERTLRTWLRWRIADLINRIPGQCWSSLVDWALHDPADKGWGFRAALPWRPVEEGCHNDAKRAGRCYCGSLGSDGAQLRYGEYVCVTSMPGRSDRMCSRPGGHDGPHRCGAVEWAPIGGDHG